MHNLIWNRSFGLVSIILRANLLLLILIAVSHFSLRAEAASRTAFTLQEMYGYSIDFNNELGTVAADAKGNIYSTAGVANGQFQLGTFSYTS
jgi:hypothetical protein